MGLMPVFRLFMPYTHWKDSIWSRSIPKNTHLKPVHRKPAIDLRPRVTGKSQNGCPLLGHMKVNLNRQKRMEPGPGRESRKSWKLLKFLIAYKAEGVFNICFWRVGNNGYIHGKTSFQSYLCYQYMYKLAEGDMPGAFTRRPQWQKGRLPGFCPALPSFESFPVCINRRALWSVLYRRDCISVPCI